MMDDFGLYPREEPFDPFSVMLFKALQVIAFLFFLALLAISPDSKDGKIDSKAEFINHDGFPAPERRVFPSRSQPGRTLGRSLHPACSTGS